MNRKQFIVICCLVICIFNALVCWYALYKSMELLESMRVMQFADDKYSIFSTYLDATQDDPPDDIYIQSEEHDGVPT